MNIKKVSLDSINNRYSGLAESNCCLSCGGAIDYAKIEPGFTCADLGSGRGNDVMRMAELTGNDGFVYGIDVSEGMIDKANRSAKKLGINNVEFIKSDLENLNLNSDSVDVLISNCTINHASNKDKVWQEVFRVLKKGGRFIVSDIYSIEEVPEEYVNDPEAIAECWAGAVERDVYIATLAEAGFNDVNIIEESNPYNKGKIKVASWTIEGIKK